MLSGRAKTRGGLAPWAAAAAAAGVGAAAEPEEEPPAALPLLRHPVEPLDPEGGLQEGRMDSSTRVRPGKRGKISRKLMESFQQLNGANFGTTQSRGA